MSRSAVFLVDGTSQLYRAYHALPPMNNAAGLPTHAVFGFVSMLRKLLKDNQPRYLAVAFDLPGRVFRHDTFAAYKANRPPTPEDMKVQLPYAKRACEVLGLPIVELAGYEADDLIASYARAARAGDHEVVIVGSDKDLLQLVQDGVRVFNPTKEIWLDPGGVAESFGVPPERVLDAQALMGDSVDNIPGVPGVGKKTALTVVSVYGDIETCIARAGRFVAVYDARDRLLAAIDALDGEASVAPATADAVRRAAAELASALGEFVADEADLDMRERARALLARLAEFDFAALAAGAGKSGAVVAKPVKPFKKDLKAMDRGSSRTVWYAISEHADQARLSKRLATLHHAVPLPTPLERLIVRQPEPAEAAAFFRDLGFRALIAEFEADSGGAETTVHEAPRDVGGYETVTDAAQLRAWVAACAADGQVGLAVVIDGPDPLQARAVGIAIARAGGRAAYIPLAHDYLGVVEQLSLEQVRASLGPLLSDGGVTKVGHDVKRVSHVLRRLGVPVDAWLLDVMVAGFLIEPGRSNYPLDDLAHLYLGRDLPSAGSRTGHPDPAQQEVRAATLEAAGWADTTLRLAAPLGQRLAADRLDKVYAEIDGPLLPLLETMERHGIRIDTELLARMSIEMERHLAESRARVHELAGLEFNVDSPKQLREVLYEHLGLKAGRKTAKSKVASTDAQALEDLAADHAIAREILEYRETAKLKSTYVDSLPRLVHPETGRVHTSYNPTGAATGRLSSSDPNLQNIPTRTEAGRRIRAAFVADDGFVLLASDYSQIELRVLAHMCADEALIAAFQSGDDIHRYTAAKVFGVLPGLVTGAMRTRAKAVNFGILYGMSETRLAREQGMTRTDARRFIQAYFDRFPNVRRYIDAVRQAASTDAEVRTLFGRVRRFPQLHGRVHRGLQEQALRAAVNTTLQGTAADLMKLAMLRVAAELDARRLEARVLLQVHDELLLEVPEAQLDDTREAVRLAMETVYPMAVPLVVDQKCGSNWSEVS